MKRPTLEYRLAHARVKPGGDTPIYDALARWFDPAAKWDLTRKPIVLEVPQP